MPDYTTDQIKLITDAIINGREAIRRTKRYEALEFAQAFIEHDVIQIPGAFGDDALRKLVAESVLASLRSDSTTSEDVHVRREIKRSRDEARWALATESDKVVGFVLTLGPAAAEISTCGELLSRDHGLGAAVYPKEQVVVLPPACDDYQLVPVLEDEVEQ